MNEEKVINQMKLIRSRTLKAIEEIDEGIMDSIPANYNNSIQWHIGHILIVRERLCLLWIGEAISLPEEYSTWFGNGTKPADWQSAPPSAAVLISQLREQDERLISLISGRLDEVLNKPFQGMDQLWEIVNYSNYHEGYHLGFVQAMKRSIMTVQ